MAASTKSDNRFLYCEPCQKFTLSCYWLQEEDANLFICWNCKARWVEK